MSVLLPTFPGPAAAEGYFLDAGGVQRGLSSGEDMRLDRLGDRFGVSVSLVPMRWNDYTQAERTHAAMVWLARLIRGKSEGAVFPWPQPGFKPPGNPSTAAAAAVTGAAQVQIVQVGAAAKLLEGQFLTHIRAATGRRYLYQVRSPTDIGTNGQVMLPIWPRIRGPIAPGDTIDLVKPTIEGLVVGDQQSWSTSLNRLTSTSFRIEERG